MTRERAQALNNILENIEPGKYTPNEDVLKKCKIGNENWAELLQILHAAHHIADYSQGKLNITDTGFTFMVNGGYLLQVVDEQAITISELTIINLKLQNDYLPHAIKQTKNRGWIDLSLFIGGALVTYGGVFLTNKLQETREQKKQPNEIRIVLSPTTRDTTVKIYADSLKSDSCEKKPK